MRDWGFDCDFLLFNDELEHFHPECDTFEKADYSWIKQLSWGSEATFLETKSQQIKFDLYPYDVLIGCGLAPAYLDKMRSPKICSVTGKLKFLVNDKVVYGGATALSRFVSLVTFPLIARHFSPEDCGLLDFLGFYLLL